MYPPGSVTTQNPPVYYIWGPQGREVFDLGGRLGEILAGLNPHPHHNNGTAHGGNGGPDMGTWRSPHLFEAGHAFYQLPPAPYHGYYREYVWNRPGLPAGMTRLIVGAGGELYITWDHYFIYIRVYVGQGGTRTVF